MFLQTGWPFDFVLQLLLPLIVTGIAFVPYLMRLGCGKVEPGELLEMRNDAIASSLGFINVTYLTVSQYSLSAFRCITLANGDRVLDVYPSIICGTLQHTVYMALGCVGTICYLVGFPVLVGACILHMHRRRLHTDQNWVAMFGWVCARV